MKKIRAILIIELFLLALLLGMPLIDALEYRYYCLNTATLQKEATIKSNISGTTKDYVINQSITCQYGCDTKTNTCQPPAVNQTMNVAFIIFGLLAVAGIIWKLKD